MLETTDMSSVTMRFAAVLALTVVLMIPLLLVDGIIVSREGYHREALDGVAQSRSGPQQVVGPLLVIPVLRSGDDDTGRGKEHSGHLVIVPQRLNVQLDSRHEVRRRSGIFRMPVLEADVVLSGSFAALDPGQLRSRFGALRLDEAWLAVGIPDIRGVRSARIKWHGSTLMPEAGTRIDALPDGIHAGLPGTPVTVPVTFDVSLSLRATGRLAVVPAGDDSVVTMTSTWPHPSFDGRFLPDSHEVSKAGFSANWTAQGLARGFPTVSTAAVAATAFARHNLGFTVVDANTPYRAVARATKYGMLLISLTLISVLCIELLLGMQFHLVQYGVVGIGLVLFYLVFISLAEYIGFTAGYIVAAAVLTGMTGSYARAITRSNRSGATFTIVLASLYTTLYVVLRLESYSLLAGTALLVGALAVLMWATCNLKPTPAPASAQGTGSRGTREAPR